MKLLYPDRISNIAHENAIYLTFDDGPVPEATPWVLDLLKKYDAKASFFCIGDNVKKHPDIFLRIKNEGHCIGNHTFNHYNGWITSKSHYIDNTWKAEEVMTSFSRQKANKKANTEPQTPGFKLFRPPYGRIKNSQARLIKEQGFKIVMWDVISGDYEQEFSAEKCYKHVIENSRSGSTIVFHDSKKAFPNLEVILPKILEYYSEKGFEFRSLKDVL